METTIKNEDWVYVVVQNPGGDESLLGLDDKDNRFRFIPSFMTKEEAESNFIQIPREKGKKYEIQAIIYEDLARYAKENGFRVVFLNDEDNTEQ